MSAHELREEIARQLLEEADEEAAPPTAESSDELPSFLNERRTTGVDLLDDADD